MWPHHAVPTDCKLLHNFEVGGENVQQLCINLTDQCAVKNVHISVRADELSSLSSFPCVVNLQIFGTFWSEVEFVNEAMKAGHPLDPEIAMLLELKEVLKENLHAADHALISQRASFLARWTRRAKELSAEEAQVKQQMDPEIARFWFSERCLKPQVFLMQMLQMNCNGDLTW